MECTRCHTPIPDGSRFCLSCGADLSDPVRTASTTAAMDAAKSAELERLTRQEVGSEFEIERELGRGGMAVVYLATEIHLGRKVAIKVLPPDLTFAPGTIDRFKREARTAATLDHPNIIPIHRVSPGGRLFWYAMKFLEGRSLAEILKDRGRLSLDDALRVLNQVASALDYAHARNVIHRDIKPANIMLDATQRVIVTDFGIAKQLDAGSLTSSGSAIGTPYYMSPEQCHGSQTLTGAADQYSLGIMTYQMLSGQLPFEGDSVIDILAKHCTEKPPPLDVLRPGLPRHVYQAVDRALAKKAEERFPAASAFVEALRKPGRASATVAASKQRRGWDRSTTAARAPRPRRRWMWMLGAAIASGTVLGGTWLALSQSAPPLDQSAARSDSVGLTTAVSEAATPKDSTRPGLAPGIVRNDTAPSQPAAPTSTPKTSTASGARVTQAPARQARLQPTEPAPRPHPGILVVRTVGGWARIYVDGVLRAEGTSHRDSLSPGPHRVRLEREGYVPVDTTVAVRTGELQVVTITMRPQ